LGASATWAAPSMLVMWWAWRVSAVATITANMTRLENVMPTNASSLAVSCLRWALLAEGLCLGAPLGFVTHLFEVVGVLPVNEAGRAFARHRWAGPLRR
jgi:hypothetical protein